MKNLSLLILVCAFLVPTSMMAEWIPLKSNKTQNTPPKVTLISSSSTSTVVKVELTGFDLQELATDGKTYHQVGLMDEIYTSIAGSPQLPYIAKVLAIPDQSGVSVEVIETGDEYTFNNISLPPARESWWEGAPEPAFVENYDAYRSATPYPAEMASMDAPSVFRDFRISRLAIYPVRYIASKSELKVYSSITVRVNYGEGEVINPKLTKKNKIAPSFAALYRSTIFNYEEVLNRDYGGKEDGREVMLCIMPDIFTASFQVYANWKRQTGTDIKITKFSDIGANGTNPDIVKNHITQAYNTWTDPPTYILIIGDNGVFPKKIVTYPGYSFAWEEYFVTVAGNDYFPEMMIGRFTNQEDYRMQVMISKYMRYEKEPYVTDPSWFKKATLCSNNEYESQVETKRFVKEVLQVDGLFTQIDTMMSNGNSWGGGCTYSLNNIKNAINQGRSYLNYRGEGWYYGWYANCYDFSTSDVSSLNNGEKLTFVTSIGCGVAMFDASGGNCFGEEWIQMGTPTAPRGGVAFLGPTSNTHTTYNNRIDKGIYVGMFREGMDTPGQAMQRGKLYMYNVFGNEYNVEYHYKVFCALGDPSIHIWKNVPYQVNVNYPTTIPVGNNEIEVQVNFTSTGFPASNAQVTIVGTTSFASQFTDADGKVTIAMELLTEENLTITVRGGNVIPFQGTIEVIQPDELIEPQGAPVVDDIDGNNDGKVNPNENCTITYTLKNWGSTAASNVQGSISSVSPYVQIITPNISFGNLAPGGQITGNPFQFFVLPDCPVGTVIPIQLHVTSALNSWDYNTHITVKGCQLTLENFVVYDAESTSPNFRLDAGETVVLVISVKNYGEDNAPNVHAAITTNDPYITILDGSGAFGTIQMEGSAINPGDNFVIAAGENCPAGYMADITVTISTENGLYPYQVNVPFKLPVSKLVPKDYTGPDSYGYYAYSGDDTFYDETPDYDWMELVGIGTQIGLPSISDYTTTVNLPFAFKYYGINYNQLRISTDGWVAFGSGSQTAPVNTVLPANDNVNNMVAVFWDDLYDDEFYMGKIYHYHDVANHRFIVEWDSISHNNFISEPVREDFQLILLDPAQYSTITGDGEIIMQYRLVRQPETVTIGIENNTQTIGLQYVFDQDYSPTASPLSDGYAIKFTTDPPFATMIVTVDDHQGSTGKPFGLTNQPNPFNDFTIIQYQLPESGPVTLEIYDIRGKLVRVLLNEHQQAGNHSMQWNGMTDHGVKASPGLYFLRMQSGNSAETEKLMMIR